MPALVATGITENKKTLKQRITHVAVFSKNKYRITFVSILIIAVAAVFLCTSQMAYPKTAQERMQFDDNIRMSFNLNNINNPKSLELQINNNNKIAVHSCELEIYSGNPNKPDNRLIYTSKGFRLGGGKTEKFQVNEVDYNNAYVKFSYKVGLAFNDSNKSWRSGDLRAMDHTLKPEEWKAASREEIDRFINENSINAIAINQIYNLYTIILFENGNSSGYYELYKDARSNELRSRRVVGYHSGSELPVRMAGGTASGNYPFANFIINSPVLRALGDKIEIQTANGTIAAQVSGEAAYTIQTRGYGSVRKILIYDKDERLIFDGEKLLLEDVEFNFEDPSYANVIREKGYKIVDQSPISHQVVFTAGMFPDSYVIAHKSHDIDLKIPLFTYENTTVYLKSIVESNESPEYLYASFYLVHNIDKSPGKILSSIEVNFQDGKPHSYGSNTYPRRDVLLDAMNVLKDTVSLRGSGPGDQIVIYLDRSMVEETKGNFTVTLEGLNLISYIPS